MATAASSRLAPLKTATRAAIKAATAPATAKGAHSGPGITRLSALSDPSSTATSRKAIASAQTSVVTNR